MVIRPGRAPIRSSGGAYRAAIAFLRSLGTSAHVWLPGANGISVASLPSNNYLLSDFATLAAVDEVVGGVKDGMNPSGGVHLTQPTTANKPMVRRGAYNLLTYSQTFENAAWSKTFTGTGVLPVATDNYLGETGVTRIQVDRGAGGVAGDTSMVAQSITSVIGSVYYGNCEVKATAAGNIGKIIVSRGAGGAGYRAITLTANWQTFGGAETAIATASTLDIGLRGTIGSCSQTADFLIRSAQHTKGAAAEDYTPTTATAASNPSAGKYWWSFNGSKNSLLSGNLGITNACTIVIAGRVDSLAPGLQMLCTEDTNGAQIYINNAGRIYFSETGVSDLVFSAAGVIVAGVPFVITARLSGGNVVLRLNGVQIATAVTGETFSAITGVRLGTDFAGTGHPLNGALGWVVPSAVGLSDADCLTVERLVGSQFPGMAVF